MLAIAYCLLAAQRPFATLRFDVEANGGANVPVKLLGDVFV
jgi:hypothetical protein